VALGVVHQRPWLRHTTEPNYVVFVPSTGCSSHIGKAGGRQNINLASDCDTGSVIHEIGHAVGAFHEQARVDRDQYVDIFWDNIDPEQRHNYQTYLQLYPGQDFADDMGPYDFNSIMHYSSCVFSRYPQCTPNQASGRTMLKKDGTGIVGNRTALSAGDIAAVRAMYMGGAIETPPASAIAHVGMVRNNTGWLTFVDAYQGTRPWRLAGWDECPAGYSPVGHNMDPNGFWLCVRNDVVSRTFYFGNVVNNQGQFFRVQQGAVQRMFDQGWNYCPNGTLLGQRFASDGFWLCIENEPKAEVWIGSVRADAGYLDMVKGGGFTARLSMAGWNACPAGYSWVGTVSHGNGFWLCARNDLVYRRFYVGNVVNDAGYYYSVQNGAVGGLGYAGWNYCRAGELLARRFEPNGYWVCME
jgi:hypothetical protein